MTDVTPAAPKPAPPAATPAPKRKRRGGVASMLGIAAGLAGLAAGRLSALRIEFDVFNQFLPQFALVTAAFAIGYLMPRVRVLTALALIIAGLAANSLWPQIRAAEPLAIAASAQGERAIKIMTFNTWFANQAVDAIGDEIEKQAPDIVMMVEFGPNKRPLFARFKGAYPHQLDCLEKDFCNLVVLSKFPFAATETRVGWNGPPVIRVAFGPELGGLNLFGVHTIRFPHQRAQFRQFVELAKMLEAYPGQQIVMGDFNATRFSRMLASFEASSGLNRLTGYLPTWPARFGMPQIGIDHIFASPGIRPLAEIRIGANAGSDHFPVVATVAVPVN